MKGRKILLKREVSAYFSAPYLSANLLHPTAQTELNRLFAARFGFEPRVPCGQFWNGNPGLTPAGSVHGHGCSRRAFWVRATCCPAAILEWNRGLTPAGSFTGMVVRGAFGFEPRVPAGNFGMERG